MSPFIGLKHDFLNARGDLTIQGLFSSIDVSQVNAFGWALHLGGRNIYLAWDLYKCLIMGIG